MATASPQLTAAIPGLVAQLRGSSRVGRASAVKALCALAAQPEYLSTILAVDGLVPTLVARLCDSGATIQASAAGLLTIMVQSSPSAHAAALAAGAMPRLVALLGSGTSGGAARQRGSVPGNKGGGGGSSSSGVEAVQVQALQAIRQLSDRTEASDHNEAGAAALHAAGGIAAVVRLLHSSASPSVLVQAAAVLAEAPVDSEERAAAAVEAGAYDALVPLLWSGSDEVQHRAAWACRNLAWGPAANKIAAADAGCVPSLLRLLRGSSGPAEVAAAAALRNLAASGSYCVQALLDAGAAQLIIDYLCSLDDGGSDVFSDSDSDGGSDACSYSSSDGGSDACSYSSSDGGSDAGSSEQEDAAELAATALAFMAKHGGPAAVDAILHAAGGGQLLHDLLLTYGGEYALELAAPHLPPEPKQAAGAAAAAGGKGAAGRHGKQQQQQQQENQPPAAQPQPQQQESQPPGAKTAGPAAAPAAARPPAPKLCAAEGCSATQGLRRCGGCASVRYCSVACCRAHWPAHKVECRRLQAAAAAAGQLEMT